MPMHSLFDEPTDPNTDLAVTNLPGSRDLAHIYSVPRTLAEVVLNAASQVELKVKTPWRDGTTHIFLPLEFGQRLIAPVAAAQRRAQTRASDRFAPSSLGHGVPVKGRPAAARDRRPWARDVERTAKPATSALACMAVVGRRPLSGHGRPAAAVHGGRVGQHQLASSRSALNG